MLFLFKSFLTQRQKWNSPDTYLPLIAWGPANKNPSFAATPAVRFWLSEPQAHSVAESETDSLPNSSIPKCFFFPVVPLTANPVMNWYEAICSLYLSHHNDLQQKYQCV